MKSKLVLSYVAFMLSSFLFACSDNANEVQASPLAVATTPISQAPRLTQQYTATLVPRFQTNLAFQVNGIIAERQVEAGQHVDAGTVIATLNPSDFLARQKAAAAALQAAERNYQKAANDLQRGKTLFANKSIGEEQLEAYQVAFESAERQRQQARSELQQADNALDYTQLKAPQGGTLVSVTAEPGLVVNAGQPVAQIAQGGQAQVLFDMPSDAKAQPSAELVIAGQQRPLSLFSQAGAVNPQSFTREVRYNLDQPLSNVVFGSLAQVTMQSADSAEGLQIPLAALDQRGDSAQVWIIKEGKAATVAVQVVRLTTAMAIIKTEQLTNADSVISQGINRLTEGQPVSAVN
ncbi:MAG: efflux RND transporter periplasmic adaptor subunit [Pseudomonadota bacterium]